MPIAKQVLVTPLIAEDAWAVEEEQDGYNRHYDVVTGRARVDASNEYVFVYDVRGNAPVETQVVQVANAFGSG